MGGTILLLWMDQGATIPPGQDLIQIGGHWHHHEYVMAQLPASAAVDSARHDRQSLYRCVYKVWDKQMHQKMLQMCAAPIRAADHASQALYLAFSPGACMWNA